LNESFAVHQLTRYDTEYVLFGDDVVSVPHALLALLSEGPKYGQQLQQEFEARTGEVWPLNVGQVYTTLQRLERDGLVEADDSAEVGRRRRRLRLTPEGGRVLDGWLRSPTQPSAPARDELLIKVLIASRLPGVRVSEVVQVHRRTLVEMMQRYTQLKSEAAGDEVGFSLVLDAELFRLEAAVRWLDAAEAHLKRLPTRMADVAPPVQTREVVR
jgi:DNA-binding PadR family transcriptional regulator